MIICSIPNSYQEEQATKEMCGAEKFEKDEADLMEEPDMEDSEVGYLYQRAPLS